MNLLAHNSVVGTRFRVERFLAEGGYAVVYLAHDLAHSDDGQPRQVALKMLRHEWCSSPTVRERFEREGRFLSRIAHAHVVHCYAVGASPKPWMALEYVAGPTLEAVLKQQKRLATKRAMTTAAAILDALCAAQDAGITHRDIKPSNVVLVPVGSVGDSDESVKLLDFGLARQWPVSDVEARLTDTGEIVGTPLYMAPERITQQCDVDPRADVWSVGVMLFEMLTGTPPHTASTYWGLLERILTVPAPALSSRLAGIDPALDGLLSKALQPEPWRRFADARGMKLAVDQWLVAQCE